MNACLKQQHRPLSRPLRFSPVKGLSAARWTEAQPTPIETDREEDASNIYPQRYSEVKALMNDLHVKCSKENWDGEGASPVNQKSHDLAFFFLLHLPKEIPLPEVWCEPTGRVVAEWFSKRASVAVAFKDNRDFVVVGYNQFKNEIYEKTDSRDCVIKLIKSTLFA